jgi:hypothetical protein
MFAVRSLDYTRKLTVHVTMLTYSHAQLTSIVSIMILTLRPRWNSHLLGHIIEYLRALREGGLEGKWPESQDASQLQEQKCLYAWDLTVTDTLRNRADNLGCDTTYLAQ